MRQHLRWMTTACRMLLPMILISISANGAAAEEKPPNLRVESMQKVFDNGEHNAFTDLCRFGDRYYLTFRSCPTGHGVSPAASVIVLASDDARQWEKVHQFSVAKRDTRDPHFLVFQGKLFVYTGTWYCGEGIPETRDMNEHLGYAVWTADGRSWHGPTMLEGTYGHYVWRAATFDDKAYLCGRRKHEFTHTQTREDRDPLVESAMLESDDGLIWRKKALFQEEYGDETAFLFEPDGSVLAVARSGSGRPAQVCRSAPPYTQWERKDLDRYIGGPLVVRWGNHYLVGGRKTMGSPAVTSLCWLVGDTLHEFAELESGGDNSYPGFVQLSDDRALVSYYSTHETDSSGNKTTAIYTVELVLDK